MTVLDADGRPLLARGDWDRGALHRTDPDWLASAWRTARVLRLSARMTTPAYRTGTGAAASATLAYQSAAAADPSTATFLGVHDGHAVFAVAAEPDEAIDASEGVRWRGLRELGAQLEATEAGLVATAVGLAEWHARHLHCPRCGGSTSVGKAGWTRICDIDGSEHFPRTDPAVIMLVHDGAGRCVLGRQPSWPPGRYSVLAGFVEPGESLEAAVAREVFEEVGLRITDVRYVASQPWPFPSSLMVGFIARASGSTELEVDSLEIETARWFSREQLDEAIERDAVLGGLGWATQPGADADPEELLLPGTVSIARMLIERWIADKSLG